MVTLEHNNSRFMREDMDTDLLYDYDPNELAKILYDNSLDMDYRDYEDTKERDIADLTKALDMVLRSAKNVPVWKALYLTLDRIASNL